MKETAEILFSTFQECKESGSFVLFYFLALGLGLAVGWDRYGKTEMEDNWMVEEAKKQIQLWPFLYGLLALVTVMCPLVLWGLNRITPVAGQYYKVWGLLLCLFLCAYGMVCFLSIIREKKHRPMVALGFVLLIGLAGSGYGLTSERADPKEYTEEAFLMEEIKERDEDALVLADAPVVEYMGVYEPEMRILYGKDLYTADMDLGIMDTYPTELLNLYEAMKQPKGAMGEISSVAVMFDCDVLIIKQFENAPDKAGVYYKRAVTENYILYMR